MKKIFIPFIAISLVFACSSSDSDSDNGGQDTFNRQAMLSNWADNIIVPAIQGFSSSLDQMVSAKNDFIANPDQTTLTNLRTSWLSAYSNWQYVEIFNIGPAESINYAFQMNIYPTNVQDIQNNIANGNYDLTSVNNNDAVGFPAVDYLLYGIADNDSDILNAFTSDANANGNTQYLSDVIDQMQTLTNTVLTNCPFPLEKNKRSLKY